MKTKALEFMKQSIVYMLIAVLFITSMPAIQVKAEQFTTSFNYTGGVQTFTAPYKGNYTIEAYGAQGGGSNGGKGSKTTGTVFMNAGDTIDLAIGGQGSASSGGYNGGGAGDGSVLTGGGGATSITKGESKGVLSNYKDSTDDILMVAAGGGGQNASSKYVQSSESLSPSGADVSVKGRSVKDATSTITISADAYLYNGYIELGVFGINDNSVHGDNYINYEIWCGSSRLFSGTVSGDENSTAHWHGISMRYAYTVNTHKLSSAYRGKTLTLKATGGKSYMTDSDTKCTTHAYLRYYIPSLSGYLGYNTSSSTEESSSDMFGVGKAAYWTVGSYSSTISSSATSGVGAGGGGYYGGTNGHNGTSYGNTSYVDDYSTSSGVRSGNGYVKITLSPFVLTINPNGGTYNGTTANTKVELFSEKTTTVQDPARTGYTFLKWDMTGADDSQFVDKLFTMGTKNTTLTADWEEIIYSITYDLNGGTVSGNPETYTITKDTFTLNNPTKEGYTFIGWTGSNGTTPEMTVAISKGTWGNKQYTANYRINTSTLVINPNGGTWEGISSIQSFKQDYNTTKDVPAPYKKGYLFDWIRTNEYGSLTSLVSDAIYTFGAIDNVTDTITANWTPIEYDIVFHGTENWNTEQKDYKQHQVYDELPITLLANKFTRETNEIYGGYEFIGWATEEGGQTIAYEDKQEINENLCYIDNDSYHLYAIWKKDITLTFNMNGGKTKQNDADIQLEGTVYNNTMEYPFNIKGKSTEKVLNQYEKQINEFNSYGSIIDNGVNSEIVKVDSDGTVYRLLGWSLDKDATEPDTGLCVYDSNPLEIYSIHDDTTLYAVWEPVLQVNFSLKRTLGDLTFADGSKPVDKVTNLTALSGNVRVGTIIKPGEQGQYAVEFSGGSDATLKAKFDSRITDIYTHQGTWTDSLNPSTTEDLESGQGHGLNRKLHINGKFIQRKFYMPQYIGTTSSYETSKPATDENGQVLSWTNPVNSSSIDRYEVVFCISQPSYYYEKVKGTDEAITITGTIYITLDTTSSGGNIESVLDDLRTKLKIRLKQ